MRIPGLDPEVLADLRRREAGERDRTRGKHDPYGWTEPAIVEHWPCRGGCGQMVGVTAEAIARLADANRILAHRREQPIAKGKVVWCPACKRRDDDLRALERERHRPMRQTELAGVNKNVAALARRSWVDTDEDDERPSVVTPDPKRWRKP